MQESIPYRKALLEEANHTLPEIDGFGIDCNVEPADEVESAAATMFYNTTTRLVSNHTYGA